MHEGAARLTAADTAVPAQPGGASGSVLLVLLAMAATVVAMRRSLRRPRLTAGSQDDRITGAWAEFVTRCGSRAAGASASGGDGGDPRKEVLPMSLRRLRLAVTSLVAVSAAVFVAVAPYTQPHWLAEPTVVLKEDTVSRLRAAWAALVTLTATADAVYVAVAPYNDPH